MDTEKIAPVIVPFLLSSRRLTTSNMFLSFGASIPDLTTMPRRKDTTIDILPKPETKTDEPPPDLVHALLHLATATNTRLDTLTINMANLASPSPHHPTSHSFIPTASSII